VSAPHLKSIIVTFFHFCYRVAKECSSLKFKIIFRFTIRRVKSGSPTSIWRNAPVIPGFHLGNFTPNCSQRYRYSTFNLQYCFVMLSEANPTILMVAGEIRELTNLINLGNKNQEIREHVWEKPDSALPQFYWPLCEIIESGFSHTWQNYKIRRFHSV